LNIGKTKVEKLANVLLHHRWSRINQTVVDMFEILSETVKDPQSVTLSNKYGLTVAQIAKAAQIAKGSPEMTTLKDEEAKQQDSEVDAGMQKEAVAMLSSHLVHGVYSLKALEEQSKAGIKPPPAGNLGKPRDGPATEEQAPFDCLRPDIQVRIKAAKGKRGHALVSFQTHTPTLIRHPSLAVGRDSFHPSALFVCLFVCFCPAV